MARWATTQAEDRAAPAGSTRRVHYLSMEFLIGRSLGNALAALGLAPLVRGSARGATASRSPMRSRTSAMRRSATAASAGSRPASSTRSRSSGCRRSATGCATASACSRSASRTASRSNCPTTGCRTATRGKCRDPKRSTGSASAARSIAEGTGRRWRPADRAGRARVRPDRAGAPRRARLDPAPLAGVRRRADRSRRLPSRPPCRRGAARWSAPSC